MSSAREVHQGLTGPEVVALPEVYDPSRVRARVHAAAKRLLDILVAIVGLLVLLPILLIAAAAVALDSPGCPLYWQKRIGRHGHPFRVLKLRTMVWHAEPDGRAVWAQDSDPRVTGVGALLRRPHFDEIPQLWNVLLGQMSLVGPRPERPEFVELLSASIPAYATRHVVRPGITGWAQVNYKYGSSFEDAAVKLAYDLHYIRHQSPALDSVILLKTLLVMIRCEGV